ncbi:P-loop NTPase fold protein [Shewanella pealeana]|uniref:KAP P-loop domain protein n=1 Tax=Shewanella pealeana (strain ATCC 700345 / ANG-SQ1) TaxID=398579 RepID=A8GZC4_SHEPA|nr:P-loop NTPase fold protein [Shewanella pealeana]ABV85661.1 KAP P-loop domain protein [Shewanella pealeana ATCC 700345]
MKLDISFDWSKSLPIEGGIQSSEVLPPDRLNRKKYAEFIAKFLVSQGYDSKSSERHNYVLNLNAEWGAGKTYFLKRLAEDLKPHHPVVYIDAWKQDYSDDPLMTVISSMISQLRKQAGKNADDNIYKAPRKMMALLKAATPAIVGGMTKKFLGIDHLAIMDAVGDEDDIGATLKDENGEDIFDEDGKPIDMGPAASLLVKHLIDEHDAKAKSIENLKVHVKEWVEAVIGLDNAKHKDVNRRLFPAFIFVDELDRCRPSYAVEMLETIKHIFDIPGVVFVVGTDTEQLQHAVKAIYGEGFNARNYLGRFFDSRFTLRQPNIENLLEVHCDDNKLSGSHFRDLDIVVWPENDSSEINITNIATIINCFDLSARQAIQIANRTIAMLANLPAGKKVDILMLTLLLCIREKDDSIYEDIFSTPFRRAEGGTNVDLLSFLIESYEFENKTILMDFDPRVKFPKFRAYYINEHSHGVYKASLTYYLGLFTTFFGHSYDGDMITFLDCDDEEPESKIEKLLEELRISNPCTDGFAFPEEPAANSWLGCMYYHEEMEKLKPKDYKDLVELSSSLDWLDD